MAMTTADRARAAHLALVLEENGITDPRAVEQLAGHASSSAGEGEPQTIGAGQPGVVVPVAAKLVEIADARALDRYVSQLRLPALYAEWHKQVEANLAETAPDDLEAVRTANDEAAARAAEADELLRSTGDWPRDASAGTPHSWPGGRAGGAANAMYDFGREGFLSGAIDWDTAVIKAVLVDSADYAVNLATHQFLSSVAAIGRVATSPALGSKTVAAGVADAADTTFLAVTGDPCEAVVFVQSSAVGGGADVADTAQRLIGYMDTATGLPITPNGGDITLTFDNGANRIFKL